MENEESRIESELFALDELNEEFYRLAGRLYENIELLPEPVYKYMAARLAELYKQEYSSFEDAHNAAIRKKRFVSGLRRAYVPRKFLWFKNAAAKEDIEDFRLEFGLWLEERRKRREETAEDAESDVCEDKPDDGTAT